MVYINSVKNSTHFSYTFLIEPGWILFLQLKTNDWLLSATPIL